MRLRKPSMLKIISWNINNRRRIWEDVFALDADVALLQETPRPPETMPDRIEIDPSPWQTGGANRHWKAAVAKLSEGVQVERIEGKPIGEAGWYGLAISQPGTLAAARVTPEGGTPLIVASMYAPWEAERLGDGRAVCADGSAHRLISDLRPLVGNATGLRMVAAGDLNILHGYGESGNEYHGRRCRTVFDCMEALGLPFVGPQYPHGRQADPWPSELPEESRNVPTFYPSRRSPGEATRQLDFVFASEPLRDSIQVRALNGTDEWGPRDHCRVEVTVF